MNISILKGMILNDIKKEDDRIIFTTENGRRFVMFHSQECCEYVYIEDVNGNLNDLIGSPILMAEEVSNRENPLNEGEDSFLWTFYKLGTIKGSVTIRWYGSSNGWYSEYVDFEETTY